MEYPGAYRVGNSPNQDPRRANVSQVILHHTANPGNVEDVWNMFMQRNSRSVSANFLVAQDGRVFEVVNPDTGRAWTSGSGPGGSISPDHSAITFEVMNETGAPGWTISAAAQEAVAKVMAWAAARYNFKLVRGATVRGHRELPGQSTACPGGMPMDSITARANVILGDGGDDDGYTPTDRALSLATNNGVVDTVLREYKAQSTLNTVLAWEDINRWALSDPSAGLRVMVKQGFNTKE